MRHERGRPPHPELLTPAEQRVLAELREGRANAEIAVHLGISVNTVRYHVSNILGKLEVPNRVALRATRERRWGWLGGLGWVFVGRGSSGVGVLAASIAVGVVAALLLVVGSGRATVPSGVEAEPSAVVSEVVVEPQEVEGVETRTPAVSKQQDILDGVACAPPLARDLSMAFSAAEDAPPAQCQPIALLRARSLADAFEVPVETD